MPPVARYIARSTRYQYPGSKKPFYRVEEFYSEMNLNVIFGEDEKITADALLAKAHPNRVYLALALSAIKVHQVETRTIHADKKHCFQFDHHLSGMGVGSVP
jgi:hypothetical protein